MHRASSWVKFAFTLALVAAVSGCAAPYYFQAAAGQFDLLRRRRPLEAVERDPASSPQLRRQLQRVQAVLAFAAQELFLPSGGSYRYYVDLKRPYVLWDVFAAPEFSLHPRQWCFPIAGCVAYRGYFSRERASAYAHTLAVEGDDVFVGGVPAYSTLGWLADPVLGSMVTMREADLAALIFHELAHQRLYVRGDTPFNEGFAVAVEEAGLARWLAARGDAAALCRHELSTQRRSAVRALLDSAQGRLRALYGSSATDAERRRAKAAIFSGLLADYKSLRASWQNPPDFDGWFSEPLNNASLAALQAYDEDVPGFLGLLQRAQGDFPRFYREVEALAKLKPARRTQVLQAEAAAAGPPVPGCAGPAP